MSRIYRKGTGGGGEGSGEGFIESVSSSFEVILKELKLKAGAITNTFLGNESVTNEKVKPKSLEGNRLAKETLGNEEIQTNAINNRTVEEASLKADRLKAEEIKSNRVELHGLTVDRLKEGELTEAYIKGGSGKTWKKPVRVTTAVGLPFKPEGTKTGTLTATENGALVVDGVTLAVGNRLLNTIGVKQDYGIYEVVETGSAGTKYKITRASDALTGAELENATVFTHEGTVNKGKPFTCSTTGVIVVNTTELAFSEAGNVNVAEAQTITANKNFTKTIAGQGTGIIENFKIVKSPRIKAERQLVAAQVRLGVAEVAPGKEKQGIYTPEEAFTSYALNSFVGALVFEGWKPPETFGEEGTIICVTNANEEGFPITLKNEITEGEGVPVGERFRLPGKVDLVLNQSEALIMTQTPLGWLVLAHSTAIATLPVPAAEKEVVVGIPGTTKKTVAVFSGDGLLKTFKVVHKLGTFAIFASAQTSSTGAFTVFRGEWKAATAYSIGDAVTLAGSAYLCIKAMTAGEDVSPPEAVHWTLIRPSEVTLVKVTATTINEAEVKLEATPAKGAVIWISISG